MESAKDSDQAPLLHGFRVGHGAKRTADHLTKIQSSKARYHFAQWCYKTTLTLYNIIYITCRWLWYILMIILCTVWSETRFRWICSCRFNVLFLKRFGRILLVAVPRVCSKSLLLLFLLLVTRSAGQCHSHRYAITLVSCKYYGINYVFFIERVLVVHHKCNTIIIIEENIGEY